MSLLLLYWILLGVMALGVVGAFLPMLPGISLILAAILVWGIATGFSGVGWALVVTVITLVLSGIVDFLAAYFGAKQAGGSRWGQIGAVVGMVLGFLGLLPALPLGGPILGILLGAVLGAFIGEFLYRHNLAWGERLRKSLTVGFAVVVSSLMGNLVEGFLALVAVSFFVFTTWPR